MESRTLFAETPPIKLFFTASLPGAVSMLASALYQLLDGMMVGQILGETPFAAVSYTHLIQILCPLIAIQINTAVAGRQSRAAAYLHHRVPEPVLVPAV